MIQLRGRWAGTLVLLAVILLATMTPAQTEAQSKIYFSQTGHFLGGVFRSFWERNGGVTIFGYPVSEEFYQSSDGRVAQYFERARMELNQVNGQSVVSLGLIGRNYLAATGQGFPAVAPVSAPGLRYFPETGHTLRGEFRNFWNKYGGLPIFGYPISEELVQSLDDGRNYLVQYFERGRFELVGNRTRIGNIGSAIVPCQLRPGLSQYAPPAGPIQEGTSGSCAQPVNMSARAYPDPSPPGATLGFEAGGYRPGEEIALWLNLPDGTTRALGYRPVANADGSILVGFLTESRDPLGNWSIVGQGLKSDVVRVATFRLAR